MGFCRVKMITKKDKKEFTNCGIVYLFNAFIFKHIYRRDF